MKNNFYSFSVECAKGKGKGPLGAGRARINAITRAAAANEEGDSEWERERGREQDRVTGCWSGLTFNSLGHNNDVTTFAMAKQKLNTISCKQKPN